MHKHLHPAILAQVDRRLLIDGFRLTPLEIVNHHLQGLFILFDELWL